MPYPLAPSPNSPARTTIRLAPVFGDRSLVAAYNPDQPRDDADRFASDGAGAGGGADFDFEIDEQQPQEGPPPSRDAQKAQNLKAAKSIRREVAKSIKEGKQTTSQKAAISSYQDDSTTINKALRGQSKRGGKEAIATAEKIDEAIASSKTTKAMTVFRGIILSKSQPVSSFFKTGKTFTDKAFVSTAAEQKVAEKFIEDARKTDTPVLIKCEVPKGANALNMPVHADFAQGGERGEVLLPRGSKFTVSKIDRTSIPVIVTMKLVPPKPKAAKASPRKRLAATYYDDFAGLASRAARFVWVPFDLDDDDADLVANVANYGRAGRALIAAFNPDQERDDSGRFTSGGGDSSESEQDKAYAAAQDKHAKEETRLTDRHDREQESLQSQHDKENEKVDQQREKEDKKIEKQREREDSQIEKKREREDSQLQKARERQDDELEQQLEDHEAVSNAMEESHSAEDDALQQKRDAEDAAMEARHKQEYDDAPEGGDLSQLTARQEKEIADLEAARAAEDKSEQERRDQEDEAWIAERDRLEGHQSQIESAREEEDERIADTRAVEDAALESRREAEDGALGQSREAVDSERERRQEAEMAALTSRHEVELAELLDRHEQEIAQLEAD